MYYHKLTRAELVKKGTYQYQSSYIGKNAQEALNIFMKEKPRHLDIVLSFNLENVHQGEVVIRMGFGSGDIIEVAKG